MKKTFNFGKVAYYGTRKINPVEVSIELRETDRGLEFAATGEIWNSKHTDCIHCGQCLDTIKELLPNNPTFNEIHRLWKRWHLNTMHAGTKKQEEALHQAGLTAFARDYEKCCKYLESVNLLVDDGYKFGTGWLTEETEEEDLNKIKELLNK